MCFLWISSRKFVMDVCQCFEAMLVRSAGCGLSVFLKISVFPKGLLVRVIKLVVFYELFELFIRWVVCHSV